MVPSSLIGAVLGVTMLVSLPREAALTGLGVFTLAYGVYNLRQGTAFQPVSSAWAPNRRLVRRRYGAFVGAPRLLIYLS